MRVLMRLGLVVFLSCFLVGTLGCASITEMARGFMGFSVRSLEKARKDAISKNFNYDYFTVYTKSLDALKEIQSYIYTKNIRKHLIAIYISEQDTTPVGIFFKEIDKDNTQIEVSSPSTYARDLISAKLFSALEIKPTVSTLEEKSQETK